MKCVFDMKPQDAGDILPILLKQGIRVEFLPEQQTEPKKVIKRRRRNPTQNAKKPKEENVPKKEQDSVPDQPDLPQAF